MHVVDDHWEPLADRFVDGHYGSLRGRVRTHVVDAQLRAHLAPPPLAVVDVGGGAGHQSIPLARAGYDVTIVDPSAAMLARAERLVAREPADVRGRIVLLEARGEHAPAITRGRDFGAVLCHGVVMYLEDPSPLLDALVELAAPGAVVSILAKSADALAMRPAHAGDWAGVLAAFDADHQMNGLGVVTRADRVEDLAASLVARHLEIIDWYGVRLFTDGWAPDRPATDAEDVVLAAELEAGRRDPYRRLSRLFHLVARRPGLVADR
jgi:SAM-dependent methyltransferase